MNKTLKDQKQREAVFAAELRATDAEDMQKCLSDMQKLAELDADAARIVTSAIRSKQIPAMGKRAGMDEEFIKQLISPLGQEKAVGFADKDEEPEKETPDFGNAEEEVEDEGTESNPEEEDIMGTDDTNTEDTPEQSFIPENDESEAIDGDESTATISVEVPADMVDEVKSAIEQFLSETFGEQEPEGFESQFGDAELGGDTEEPVAEEVGQTEPEEIEDTRSEDMDKEASKKSTKAVTAMSPEELAQRKAARQNMLTRIASEDNIKPKDIGLGKDTSFGGKAYQYSEQAQPEGEIDYPKMTMQSSEGNSLKGDPGYASIPIPTKNPENLQLKDSYTQFSFSGGDDGTLDFSADFDEMNKIPSAGETAGDDLYEIPTQQEQRKRNTTVAKVVTCQGCDNPRQAEVETVECSDCNKRLCLCSDCLDEEYCPSCAATRTACENCNNTEATPDRVIKVKTEQPTEEVLGQAGSNTEPTLQTTLPAVQNLGQRDNQSDQVKQLAKDPSQIVIDRNSEVFQARLKTAYAVATQLALAKIIEGNEVDDQVNLWINDGLSAKAMKTQGALMLRSASNASERIAATAAQRTNVRTASVNSVSTNPSFVSTTPSNSMGDLQEALHSIFMERYAE